jgi:predicted nucleic acid-binding protein
VTRPPRVYTDANVFGNVMDDAFEPASMEFLSQALAGKFLVVVSALASREIAFAPPKVQELFEGFSGIAEIVETTEEALRLRDAYVSAGFIRRKSSTDALHVALATVSNCDMIVSWNFRDIVNYRKIPLYNAVSLVNGYRSISIHSPLEVIEDED